MVTQSVAFERLSRVEADVPLPPGYKNELFSSGQIVLIETDLDDVVEAAKVLAGYVWLGMVSP